MCFTIVAMIIGHDQRFGLTLMSEMNFVSTIIVAVVMVVMTGRGGRCGGGSCRRRSGHCCRRCQHGHHRCCALPSFATLLL